MIRNPRWLMVILILAPLAAGADCLVRGTGDLGLVIERSAGSVLVVDRTARKRLFRVEGLGDVSHASVVYSPDERYGFVFGRDGGLTKVDLLCGRVVKRVVQAGNSVGGAISQDGRLVAVSNYEPGGVRVFDARTLELVADLPAKGPAGQGGKVVGLVDAPGGRFVYSVFDSDAIHIVRFDGDAPRVQVIENVGRQPYDALITPDGRYYIAGLFGEDGLALVDLWHPEKGARKILAGYGRGEKKLPVYKMPHLEGWAVAGNLAFLPAVGRHEVLVVDMNTWEEKGRIAVAGQPVFVEARPDGRQVWVNFAIPDNGKVQVIDAESLRVVKTLEPGRAILHMEFAPRGEVVWLSARDDDRVLVYDTATFQVLGRLDAVKPSGIFFTWRADHIGL
jgi:protein NirF